MNNKVIIVLLSLCLLGIIWIGYYQQIYIPQRLGLCHDMAVAFEKQRYDQGDLEVTNQDISGYMKNVLTCFIER